MCFKLYNILNNTIVMKKMIKEQYYQYNIICSDDYKKNLITLVTRLMYDLMPNMYILLL